MTTQRGAPHAIPKALKLRNSDRKCQPRRAEYKAEMDMPGLSLDRAREAFLRPFRLIHDIDWAVQLRALETDPIRVVLADDACWVS